MTQNVGTTSGESQDPEPVLPAPGERRKLREGAHLTYEQVAAAVGVTGTTVRSWELGRTEPRGRKRESYAAFLAGLSERAAAHGHPAGGHARPRPKSPARRAPHDPAPSRTPAPPPSRSTHPGPATTPTAHPLPTTPSAQAPPRPNTPPPPQTAQPPQAAAPHHPAQPPQAARAAQATPSPQPTQATPSPQPAHTDRAAGATPPPQSPPATQATPRTQTTPARATPGAPAITGMSAPEAAPDASEPRAAMGAPAIIGMSPPGAPDTPATANGSAATSADTSEVASGPPGAPVAPWTPNPLDAQAAAPEVAPGATGSPDTPIARWDPSALAPAANGSAATSADAPELAPRPPGAPAAPWTPNPLDAQAAAELAPRPAGAGGAPEAPATRWDPGGLDPADAPGEAGGLDTPPAPAPAPAPEAGADSGDPAEPPAPLTPADVFDALYDRAAPALLRQAYLLTGRRALAMESVERAFHLAWNRWPELIADPDPVGWVRSAAYEYALSPWHQFRRAHRHPDKPPAEPADRILLDAMLQLSPMHRRTVLLYDGIGLDLPDTAAETEATTPTAGGRLLRAHAELAARIPELAAVPPEKQSAVLRHRLGALRPSVPLEPRPAVAVRGSGEHRTRLWGRAVLGLTAMIAVATSYTLSTAPTHYIPPLAPGASVSGVPPLSGPQHLTQRSKALHDKLRNDPEAGPARLAPKAE
ncbi:helix-turn-helix domain-containing protein [Streptomyces goshikiensis]|uniref:helix-turn-helix domain-containing protein n=1 Tax=Streptomyces goshikiensis TaxID=1942 RepID=UPI0036CEAC98